MKLFGQNLYWFVWFMFGLIVILMVTVLLATLLWPTRFRTGPSGACGFEGVHGLEGAVGTQGASGQSGLSGPSGLEGASGGAGPPGAASGPSGISGPSGASGFQGPSGASGTSGILTQSQADFTWTFNNTVGPQKATNTAFWTQVENKVVSFTMGSFAAPGVSNCTSITATPALPGSILPTQTIGFPVQILDAGTLQTLPGLFEVDTLGNMTIFRTYNGTAMFTGTTAGYESSLSASWETV